MKKNGYKVINRKSEFNHRFGGSSWTLPICENCNDEFHQIITLDLNDPRLSDIIGVTNKEIPLISCLNCSSSWEKQFFKLDFENKTIKIIEIEDEFHDKALEEDCFPVPLEEVFVDLENLSDDEVPTDEETFDIIFTNFGNEYFCRVLGEPLCDDELNETCPVCGEKMTYIAMIGGWPSSDEPIIGDRAFFIGEYILYFSLCKKCDLLYVESR
ncbi:hypothetical protein, partial [Intestinibacter sp.]